MNGIDPKSAARFWDTWHLVTVRYRKDNEEQRFVYANNIAWRALRAGKKQFPSGSMFGKIAFATKLDGAFPSSVETKNYTRVQLMLKDATKFKKTNGWTYALYVAGHEEASSENSSVATACHACHSIVPQRDFVFSRSSFSPVVESQHGASAIFKDQFQLRRAEDLPAFSRSVLNALQINATNIQYLALPLFSGSISEVISPMIAAAKDLSEPLLLADEKQKIFFVAKQGEFSTGCAGKPIEFMFLNSSPSKKSSEGAALRTGYVCNEQINWSTKSLSDDLRRTLTP